MHAILKNNESAGYATCGDETIEVSHGIKYVFGYDGGDTFYLLVDGRLFEQPSTAFDFV